MKIEEQHELSKCLDELYQDKAQTSNDINLITQQIKEIDASTTLVLKDMKDEKGKNTHTEITIKALIVQHVEVKKLRDDLIKKEFEFETIEGKIKATECYRIDCRDRNKEPIYLTEK